MRKLLVFIVLLTILSVGYLFYEQTKYTEVIVKEGTMQLIVAAAGTLHADREANLRFGSTGRITSLPFRENSLVKKGQSVAVLDTSDLRAIQERELKNYEDARRALEQQRDLYKNQAITDEERHLIESKQTEVDRSVINVEIADRAAKNASLYAPFDGVVTAVNGEINEWTNAFSSLPLVSIADLSTLYFEADVSQENSEGITEGQPVVITFDAHKRIIHHGVVIEVSQQVKTTSDGDKVIPIKINITDPGSNIKLHMDGDAQITIGEKKNVLLLPKRALQRDEDGPYVFIKGDILKQKKRVKVGEFDGSNWEVLEGLQDNAQVLVSNE